MKPNETKAGRIDFLDAVRGIAALLVVLQHAFLWSSHLFFTWFNIGEIGVITFFFVSGFIIPVSMERHSLPGFWRSRFFRLVPAYWTVIGLSLLLAFAGAFGPVNLHLTLKGVLANLAMVAIAVHAPRIVFQSWTLTIELYFYILCSGLLLAGVLRNRVTVAYAAMGVYLLWLAAAYGHLISPDHFKGRWGGYLMAAFVGSVFYGVSKGRIPQRVLYLMLPLLLLTVLPGVWYDFFDIHTDPTDPAEALAYVLLWSVSILFFSGMFALRTRTFPRPFLWLGRISYSLYLVHLIPLSILPRLAPTHPVLTALAAIVLSLPLADLSYRLVERPFLRITKGSKRSDSSPAAPILST